MVFLRRFCAVTMAAFGLIGLTTGCESNVPQCRRLTTVANSAIAELKTINQEKMVNSLSVIQASQLNALFNKYAGDSGPSTESAESKTRDDRELTAQLAQMHNLAAILDKYAKDLTAIQLKDERLLGFRQRLVDLYKNDANASRAMVVAVTNRDAATLKSNLAKVKERPPQETAIVGELNGYCGVK
jgi:small-conductance mechanosensitive channel